MSLDLADTIAKIFLFLPNRNCYSIQLNTFFFIFFIFFSYLILKLNSPWKFIMERIWNTKSKSRYCFSNHNWIKTAGGRFKPHIFIVFFTVFFQTSHSAAFKNVWSFFFETSNIILNKKIKNIPKKLVESFKKKLNPKTHLLYWVLDIFVLRRTERGAFQV